MRLACRVLVMAASLGCAAAGVGACHGGDVAPPGPSASRAAVNPARISAARSLLPAGYEVSEQAGPAADPVTLWGFGPGWSVRPPECAVLAHPGAAPDGWRGWSASGPGGIVSAVVAPADPVTPAAPLARCASFVVESGRTTGTATLVPSPRPGGITSVGVTGVATTHVEGGTETLSRAQTFVGWVDRWVTWVVVKTDPGGAGPELPDEFAARLFTAAVEAIRG